MKMKVEYGRHVEAGLNFCDCKEFKVEINIILVKFESYFAQFLLS